MLWALIECSEEGVHMVHKPMQSKGEDKGCAQEYMGGTEINISEPVVKYCETVTSRSSHMCMAKSPNKLNRMYMEARPLEDGLAEAIDDGCVRAQEDAKVRSKVLVEKFGWDKERAKKIWCFGPDIVGPNMLLDATKAVQYLSEIKGSCIGAFQWVSKEGPMAEENMRGCAFEIADCVLHSDSTHRGTAAIMPCTRRSLCAAMLCGQPRMMEPIFLVEVTCPRPAVSGADLLISVSGYQ